MNDKRRFERAIAQWLDDGSDATPPQVIDAVLLAARSTPQERDVRIQWRTSPMTYLRLAAVIAVVAVAGAAALYAFGWGPNVGSGLTPNQSQDEVVFEVALHYYTTDGEFSGVVARVPEPTRINAQLPDGWVSTQTGITNEPEEPDSPIAVSFWTVDAVFTDPCDPDDSDRADPPMMQTLDFLAGAFTAWWSRDAREYEWQPIPTRVVDSTVSGFRARYLEIRIPATVDMDRCGGRYVTWRNADNAERRHQPGDVSRLWIVEVGPDQGLPPNQGPTTSSTPLLVIDATSTGEASPEALRELDELIDSIGIEAPEELP